MNGVALPKHYVKRNKRKNIWSLIVIERTTEAKQRGEIERELRVRQAQYYGREAETPPEILARISALQRELMTIDGLFAALSENEAFVIRHHLIEELDWPQTMTLFTQKWGMEAEKSLRSMKALQEKGLRKIARLLNTRIGSNCLSEENQLF